MPTTRRQFKRSLGERRYKKLFVIASEGQVTESSYFRIFSEDNVTVRVICLPSKHRSAPAQVLKRMTTYLKHDPIKPSDECWLVVDKDKSTDDQLEKLHQWACKTSNHFLALSYPNFEYWLLLHFEDGKTVNTGRACIERLRRYLPNYEKAIARRDIKKSQIDEAVCRAKARDNPPCVDWPRSVGQTTVYRLVENILKSV